LAKPLASAVDALAKLNHKRIKRMYLGFLQGRNSNVATAMVQADLTNAVWNPQKPTKYFSNYKIGRQLVDASKGISFRDFLASHERYNVAQQSQTLTFDGQTI
jgi:hypothetical protein